jgi:RNA polymerase sigma-70 factor, ECF subfamily
VGVDDAIERFGAILGLTGDEWRGRLADLLARAVAAQPSLDLVSFAESLAGHAKASGDVDAYLQGARAEDLALAHACARGDRGAIAAFEKLYFGEIDRAFLKVRKGKLDRQDFEQRMRERLFVATDERRARIADYTGQGDLRAWFRVAMTRTLINESQRPSHDSPTDDDELAAYPHAAADPELELLRRKYSAEFRASFARALSALDARDRAILGYVVVEKMGIDALAEVYDVHRATAARWVQRARETLVNGVKSDLEKSLNVPSQELESILRVVGGEVEISIRRLLQ